LQGAPEIGIEKSESTLFELEKQNIQIPNLNEKGAPAASSSTQCHASGRRGEAGRGGVMSVDCCIYATDGAIGLWCDFLPVGASCKRFDTGIAVCV